MTGWCNAVIRTGSMDKLYANLKASLDVRSIAEWEAGDGPSVISEWFRPGFLLLGLRGYGSSAELDRVLYANDGLWRRAARLSVNDTVDAGSGVYYTHTPDGDVVKADVFEGGSPLLGEDVVGSMDALYNIHVPNTKNPITSWEPNPDQNGPDSNLLRKTLEEGEPYAICDSCGTVKPTADMISNSPIEHRSIQDQERFDRFKGYTDEEVPREIGRGDFKERAIRYSSITGKQTIACSTSCLTALTL